MLVGRQNFKCMPSVHALFEKYLSKKISIENLQSKECMPESKWLEINILVPIVETSCFSSLSDMHGQARDVIVSEQESSSFGVRNSFVAPRSDQTMKACPAPSYPTLFVAGFKYLSSQACDLQSFSGSTIVPILTKRAMTNQLTYLEGLCLVFNITIKEVQVDRLDYAGAGSC